jgi:hypothetical protein
VSSDCPSFPIPPVEYDDCPIISLVVETGVCFLPQIAEVIKDELWPNPLKYFNSDVSFYSTQYLASSTGLGSKPFL